MERKRFPFSHFIDESKNDNLINKHERSAWHFLREIRNATVHNNGIFDENNELSYNLGNRVINLEYRQNEPMRGDLDFYHIITEILVELFYSWVERFLKVTE